MNDQAIRRRIVAIIEFYADASKSDALDAAAEVMDEFDVRSRA